MLFVVNRRKKDKKESIISEYQSIKKGDWINTDDSARAAEILSNRELRSWVF
jgi:hypothetical protein